MFIDFHLALQAPTGILAEKLNRISSENKKLNQMLGVVVENYSVLKNQVIDLIMKTRKRKAAPGCDNCCNFNRSASSDQYCGCCSDDNDSCYNKRPRENNSKPKVMRVLVPTPVSDSTLVRIRRFFSSIRLFFR